MKAQYMFYEVVLVISNRKELNEINNKKGAILGMVKNLQNTWFYSVHIFDTEESWEVIESELKATGETMSREDFYE